MWWIEPTFQRRNMNKDIIEKILRFDIHAQTLNGEKN